MCAQVGRNISLNLSGGWRDQAMRRADPIPIGFDRGGLWLFSYNQCNGDIDDGRRHDVWKIARLDHHIALLGGACRRMQ
jgi:hypothetical protein